MKPFAPMLLGNPDEQTTTFLLSMGISQPRIFDYQIENYDKLKGKSLGYMMTITTPVEAQAVLSKYVKENKHWALINFLKQLDPGEVDKNYPKENVIKKADDTQ